MPMLLRGSRMGIEGYALLNFPSNFIIDRKGKIAEFIPGFDGATALEKKIMAHLE